MTNHELPGPKRNTVFLLEQGNYADGVLNQIRQDLERNTPGLYWEEAIIKSARSRWQDYLPRSEISQDRPKAEKLASFSWSHLVPESLKDPKKMAHLITLAWNFQEAFAEGRIKPGKYLVVGGTMGSGKTELLDALANSQPFDSVFSSEAWRDNKELPMFYRLLEIWASPACQRSESYGQTTQLLRKVQGEVQGQFASRKFIQVLMSMPMLASFSVIQDTPLGQDGVYAETQWQLGLASQENIAAYRQDNQQRQELLPPFLQRPILVYVWAPFEVARERILKVRGRDFESQLPEGYLLALHQNTLQWMLAMNQMGVPVLVIDAGTSDFRPGMSDRLSVAAKIWEEIDKI